MNVGDKVKPRRAGTIEFESNDDWDVWFNAAMTALPLCDGNASSAIGVADKVLRALQERRPEEPVPYVPVDLLDEGLPVYLAEQVSIALQRLPTDLGTEWTGKRREDLAVHQGIVADAIAEALQSRSAEIVEPPEQCTCPRDSLGARIHIDPCCPLEVARQETSPIATSLEQTVMEQLVDVLKPKAIPLTSEQLREKLRLIVNQLTSTIYPEAGSAE